MSSRGKTLPLIFAVLLAAGIAGRVSAAPAQPFPSDMDIGEHARFYPLVGAHTPADCAACHKNGQLKGTPKTCGGCHKDVHQTKLGSDCARCHFEDSWSDVAPFDHAKETGVPLTAGHAGLSCAQCHGKSGRRLDTERKPVTCTTCHATTTARGHGPSMGTQCVSCHNTTSWKPVVAFDHRRTQLPLDRRHSILPCAACHTPTQASVSPECRTCHGDPHRGRAGQECGQCHRADSWLVIRFDHDRTEFRLNGVHFGYQCRGCHTSDIWAGLPHECIFCHRGDAVQANMNARHRPYSLSCGDVGCHNAFHWKIP